MSAGKNPYLRYRIIHQCLKGTARTCWSAKDLLKKLADNDLSIEDRTLKEDIRDMRFNETLGYFAPIIYSHFHKGYSYSDPDYTIDSFEITDDELRALKVVSDILRSNTRLKLFEDFTSAVTKILRRSLKFDKRFVIEHQGINFGLEIDGLYSEMLEFFIEPVITQKPVAVELCHDNYGHTTDVVHPYYLKHYQSKWYILVYSQMQKQIFHYELHEFRGARVIEENFIPIKSILS
jgi:predicted DNA-binding transcriptional regulator YafY